ncbi:MAG TPA: ribonuclease Z [Vicinamibacterales bacterium]|nr:ribonuclease Z [Vicinamibacterales bacterium]
MRFTTLGTGTISLTAGRSCAGYLLEAPNVRLLIDCGAGITRRLAERGPEWQTITHVAITHFHIDHHGDLPTLIFAWKYGFLPPRSAPVEIIGPVGTADLFSRLAAAYGEWVSAPGFPLTIREVTPADVVDLPGGLHLTCHPVPHTPESVAYSMERGGRRIVYTGDTGPSEPLAAWARECDLLVCECSLPTGMHIPEHLTPEQCGDLAAAAAPKHLALTHFYPPVEQVDVRALVGARFTGPVTLAHDGWSFDFEDL